jgi:hypothetical protein
MTASWWKRSVLVGTAALAVSALWVMGQSGGGPPSGGPPGGGPPGGSGQGEHRPKPPLEQTLDANGDGVIDAGEIANAPVSLKKLDKNGDGKLTPDEYRPPRPPRPDDQGSGH